jgi:hypothetical protein
LLWCEDGVGFSQLPCGCLVVPTHEKGAGKRGVVM